MQIKQVETKDGSKTYHDEKFGETYHSNTGAKEEADKKYVETCNIKDRMEVNILDFCFGLGYNSASALDQFKGNKIKITALEIYQGIVDEIVNLEKDGEYPFNCSKIMSSVAKKYSYKDDIININLLMDDARNSIKVLDSNQFDVVFFDPFSP